MAKINTKKTEFIYVCVKRWTWMRSTMHSTQKSVFSWRASGHFFDYSGKSIAANKNHLTFNSHKSRNGAAVAKPHILHIKRKRSPENTSTNMWYRIVMNRNKYERHHPQPLHKMSDRVATTITATSASASSCAAPGGRSSRRTSRRRCTWKASPPCASCCGGSARPTWRTSIRTPAIGKRTVFHLETFQAACKTSRQVKIASDKQSQVHNTKTTPACKIA